MRRRSEPAVRRVRGDEVPEHLATYDIDQWGGVADVSAAWERWLAARRDWMAAGNRWPGGVEQMEAEEVVTTENHPDEPWRLV